MTLADLIEVWLKAKAPRLFRKRNRFCRQTNTIAESSTALLILSNGLVVVSNVIGNLLVLDPSDPQFFDNVEKHLDL